MAEYIAKCNEVVGISGKTLIVPDYIDTSKEIVRCRDCKWFSSLTEPPECYRVQGCMLVEPDGFCAWAKRKEDGE